MFIYLLLYLICLLFNYVNADNEIWSYQLWLDPYKKYSVKWNINDANETITFLCEVKTRGWIGFGLSPNGGMKGSDLIMSWVDDNTGETYFHDKHVADKRLPQIDKNQDWLLLDSKQNSTHTIIKFSRPYITCDKEFDRQITRDTTSLIYAYSDYDPKSVDSITIHGRQKKGSKSVLLLSHTESYENKPKETDLKTFILNVQNITIDKKTTTYWCKIFKFPNTKRHVVKYEPYITPGNEAFVHHITVSSCFYSNFKQLENYLHEEGADCTSTANMPKDFIHCFNPYFMWSVGGSPFSFPQDVGFPLGDQNSNIYLLLNIHYDNRKLIGRRVDSSGLKFYYTEKLRKYEASTLSVGSALGSKVFIPPNQNQFHISGHCDPKCFENAIDKEGLNVFAVWPHAHLAKEIKTRHFRGRKELPWIEFDQNYDFNLQTFRLLNPMVKIKSGDQITVECNYDSTKRNKTTLGGYTTNDEMCAAFLYYYPRMKDSKPCFSELSDQTIMTLADVQKVIRNSKHELIIELPKSLQNQSLIDYISEKQDWSKKIVNDSKNLMLKAMQKSECYWIKTDSDKEPDSLIGYPELDEIYKPVERKCQPSHSRRINLNYFDFLAWYLVIVITISTVLYAVMFGTRPMYIARSDRTF